MFVGRYRPWGACCFAPADAGGSGSGDSSADDSHSSARASDSAAGKSGGRTYSESELEQRLQGSGKELDKARKRAEAAERRAQELEAAQLKEQGKLGELYESTKAERDHYRQKLEAIEAREKERIDRLKAQNAERIAALPEDEQKFPFSRDPEEQAEQISAIERRAAERSTSSQAGAFGRGALPPKSGKPPTIEEFRKYGQQLTGAAMMGRKPDEARGVVK